ncbi:MAG: biotin--[acetyl-CoA-carboxylase] ligase [Ilumatobacteraceae bacterium]
MTPSEQIQGTGRSIWDVRDRSGEWPAGWHVRHVEVTGSTNTDLLAAAASGAPDRTVLAADHQTAGRGRLDRRWEAPPGANLLVSLLFRDVPETPGELVQRTALAAAEACRRVAGADVWLKWPNDLLLDGRKLAGILSQRAPGDPGSGARGGPVVVGLGLNVGWAPEGGARLGAAVSRAAVLRALLEAHDELPDDHHELVGRYRDRLDTLGRRVRVEIPDGEVVGRAIDVTDDGRLVVLDGCGVTHRLDVGDVVHVRPTGDGGNGGDGGDGDPSQGAEPRG